MTDETSHEVGFFIVDPDGNIFHNSENLPLDTLLELDRFNGFDNLMRFAFDPRTNGVYVQDGKIWYLHTTTGDDDAWGLLNSALKYIKQEFKAVPKLFFGEPANTAEERKFSQYKEAWEEIFEYIKTEMDTEPKDISVIEYVPAESSPDTIHFSASSGKIANIDYNGPAILINRSMGSFNQPDYNRVNHLLVHEYLRNLEQIDPENFTKHKKDDEFFFAIWKDDATKIFKANDQQRHRLLDEESLRMEPVLKDYKGPLILFSFNPKFRRLSIIDSDPETLSGYEVSRKMLEASVLRMARLYGANESNIVINHDDISNKPFVSKLSKHSIVWDLITDLCEDVKIKPQDLPVLYAPLTRDGSYKALLVKSLDDEDKIPLEREMRINHGIQINYPYIAVDSRISSKGAKYHFIIEQYAEFQPEIQHLPLIELSFNPDDDSVSIDLSIPEEKYAIMDYMSYMLEYGMSSKIILDFFAPRDRVIQRAVFSKLLKEAMKRHGSDQAGRYPIPMSKEASLDIGINDWYHIGLQESLNESAHVNDPEARAEHPKEIKPYNRKKQPQFAKEKNNLEGLLAKNHDKELGYMKSTEQLLKESRV